MLATTSSPSFVQSASRLLTRSILLGSYVRYWVRWKLFAHRGWLHPSVLVNESEVRPQFQKALRYLQETIGADNIGDYLEFGVYQGTSLRIMHEELIEAGLKQVRLFGFDSFAGLPADEEEGFWGEGWFCAEYDEVVRSLSQSGIDWERVTLIKGFFSETLTQETAVQHELQHASLIMIDCDMYSSTKEALEFCGPLIRDEAIIFFDDWNPLAQRNQGEKRAFDDFLQANPHFEAEAIGDYNWQPGDQHGKVFRVHRNPSDAE